MEERTPAGEVETMTALKLAGLTSLEAGNIMARGRVIGLIPLGAVEQHGPHLPLATDSIIAEHLANEVAARIVEPVLIAPMLPGGLSWHHLDFPGTVDLQAEVVGGYIRAYIRSMSEIGITGIAIFSAHGGNFRFIGELATDYADRESGFEVVAYDDLSRYLAVMATAAEAAGLKVPTTDAHAGGLETSQMMFLLGEERIQVPDGLEGYTAAEPGWLEDVLDHGIRALSPVGVLGRPAGASAAVGEAICGALVVELVTWMVEKFGLEAPAPPIEEEVRPSSRA